MNNAYRWSCVSSEVAWSPRDGAQRVSFEHKLFLLGGWNQYAAGRADLAGAENGTPDDVWKSRDGVEWELVAATVPWPERGNQLVANGPVIWRRAKRPGRRGRITILRHGTASSGCCAGTGGWRIARRRWGPTAIAATCGILQTANIGRSCRTRPGVGVMRAASTYMRTLYFLQRAMRCASRRNR